MTTSGTVLLTVKSGLARVSLNKPEVKNSLSIDEMTAVGSAVQAAVDAGARCILISGEGGAFCAGRDLNGTDPERDDTYDILAHKINPVLEVVRSCPVPTIAAVAGPALGFGFGLALACDMTVVADNAMLGSPFRKIGLVMDSGGHYYLRERLGRHRAAELIFTGRMLTGREAAAMGLVNRSVGAADLDDVATLLAMSIASGPTAAFAASKEILDAGKTYGEMAEHEAVKQAEAMRGTDGKEGLAAFKARRSPVFIGR
ncbi:enoyl-CoA hydratase [Pandoraea cepalis]|uniref:Enoyl-CoA hydratase n=1 Tax=Pandoraea cepalis TaxID=2508294 RepID=A0A5E4UZ08_9BURK|nr:enoyl-CoA hydratase-related protein [Pandoraea cepalis]VVE04773.1 enoyl-CoA hydratase [Pandoraea cepalis]